MAEIIKITLETHIQRFVQRRIMIAQISPQETVTELINLGFETLLQQYYDQYRRGEISFGRLAEELGVSSWELSHLLEERGWIPHNLPSAG